MFSLRNSREHDGCYVHINDVQCGKMVSIPGEKIQPRPSFCLEHLSQVLPRNALDIRIRQPRNDGGKMPQLRCP